MKLYRYMSEAEFNKFTAGIPVVGKSHFDCRTDSTGICFLGEVTRFISGENEYTFSPEQCVKFLPLWHDQYILVEFETSEDVTESFGIYADPIQCDDWYACIEIQEYCIDQYSRDTFEMTRYGILGETMFDPITWY